MEAILASEPGASRAPMLRRASLRMRTICRMIVSASVSGSMLPPLSTRPTLRPAKRPGASSTAARPAAPAPSTTVFSISRSVTIACSRRASDTSTMSSTCRRISAIVSDPGRSTAMPSAMVVPEDAGAGASGPRSGDCVRSCANARYAAG